MKTFTLILSLMLFVGMTKGGAQEFAQPERLEVDRTAFAQWDAPETEDEVIGYRLWLDNENIGDIYETEYQINTELLENSRWYNFSVAAVYDMGISDAISINFYYYEISIIGAKNLKGTLTDGNTVYLTWMQEDQSIHPDLSCSTDIITHQGIGYNNGWDVSSLHSGLSSLGYNADKDAGYKVMDKFVFSYYDNLESLYKMTFLLYESSTPISTIDGVYLTLYDGDPLNGGNIIAGDPDVNCLMQTGMINIYRTPEGDLSNTDYPIMYADAYLGFDNPEEGKEYWFIVSFTGSTDEDVHVIPSTILGETTTGEALFYTEETGWQVITDCGTKTRQGIAFLLPHYGTGALTPSDEILIYRNGELIHQTNEFIQHFVDTNVSQEKNTYGVQFVYHEYYDEQGTVYSHVEECDVYPSYPPQNMYVKTENLNNIFINHITWDKENDMPVTEDINTYYEIYRKKISEDEFTLIRSIKKGENQNYYEYNDTTEADICYYRINSYNVYANGFSESSFTNHLGDCAAPSNLSSRIDEEASLPVIGWGNIRQDTLSCDNGEYAGSSDLSYGDMMTWGVRYFTFGYSRLTDIQFYNSVEGEHIIRIYNGSHNEPKMLLKEFSVDVEGVQQWQSISTDSLSIFEFKEDYDNYDYYTWITIEKEASDSPATYTSNDNDECSSYIRYNNNYWSEVCDGEFMIRAVFDNTINGNEWIDQDGSEYGVTHYNVYRSTDNINYEKIAQINNPFVALNDYRFDFLDNIEAKENYECYKYKVTATSRTDMVEECESTPAINMDDPDKDWTEACVVTLNNEENEYDEMIIYPNPTNSMINIVMDNFMYAEITDISGRVIGHYTDTTIDVGYLSKGLYIIKVSSNDNRLTIKKLIKR